MVIAAVRVVILVFDGNRFLKLVATMYNSVHRRLRHEFAPSRAPRPAASPRIS